MTKKEWNNLQVGARVKKEWPDIKNGKFEMNTLYGTVKRFNMNGSQCTVTWGDSIQEIWEGRLGIEIVK